MDLVAGALKGSSHHKQLVQLYWTARYDYEPSWAFREHIHDFAQIIYVIEGRGSARLCGVETELFPGVTLFMTPGTPHALTRCSTNRLRTIDIKFAIMSGPFSDCLKEMCEPVVDQDRRIYHLLQRVHQEAIQNQPGHYELCNALMTESLVMILRRSQNTVISELPGLDAPLGDPLIEEVRDYIHQHVGIGFTLHDIADRFGLSQQYLAKRFKKIVGTTVHEYLLSYRIHRAKERLCYSQSAIKEIAFDVGFKSVHHFTRVFSRMEDMPPAAWRARQSGIGREGITVTPGFVSVDVTVDDESNEYVGL